MNLNPSLKEIDLIAHEIREKKIGIFPCDTIWGILGLVDLHVIEKICYLKNRPLTQPFLFLVPNKDYLSELTMEVNDAAKKLIQKYDYDR